MTDNQLDAEDGGGGRFARPGHGTGTPHGRFAALHTDLYRDGSVGDQSGSGDSVQFDIDGIYVPEASRRPRHAAPAPTPKTEAAKAERTLMPDLRQTRKNIKTALGVLLGVDVLAAAVLFSPLVGSTDSRPSGTDPVAHRTAAENAASRRR